MNVWGGEGSRGKEGGREGGREEVRGLKLREGYLKGGVLCL